MVCKVVYGLTNTIAKTKTKKTSLKVWVCYFFRELYQSKNNVIPHSIIAVILDIILNISKRRKQQQLQMQPLLKTIGKPWENSYLQWSGWILL